MDGDATFDDEKSPATLVLDRPSLKEADYFAAPNPPDDAFDADAEGFFDDLTVGPAPDLMKGPRADLDITRLPTGGEDFLDISKVPGVGDDEDTSNFTPPTVVLGRTGTQNPLGTHTFGEGN